MKTTSVLTAIAGALLAGTSLVNAAEVTPQRLANPEPQNWLMNHRTYDAQRFSPLDRINKDNVKNLKLAYSVALGGTSVNENLQATPLVEDGFMYVVDLWGIVYKIDVRSGDAGRIVWRMDPKQEKFPLSNRGAALWGNFVISTAKLSAARDRDRQGDRQDRLGDQPVGRAGRRAAHRRPARRQGQDHRSAPPAATAACATTSRRSTARPASSCGANTRIPRPASPAARPGRTRARSPGRPAAAPCG